MLVFLHSLEALIVWLTHYFLVWERPDYHSSPAISRSLDACLRVANLSKEDIDLFDFYSYCGRRREGDIQTLILRIVASPSFRNLHVST